MDPWSDQLTMLKAKPVSIVAEREKMPFEVTPFVIYLSREQSRSMQNVSTVATESNPSAGEPVDPGQPVDRSPIDRPADRGEDTK